MSLRKPLKKILPHKIRYFFRVENYQNFYFYSLYLLKRRFLSFSFSWVPLKQSIHTFSSNMPLGKPEGTQISSSLKNAGVHFDEGRHCIYISKKDSLAKINRELHGKYPCQVALKIIKSREISGDDTPYYTSRENAPASNWITIRAVGSVLEKIIISNLLHNFDCAPRVYDLVRLEYDNSVLYALVVQHIDGKVVHGESGLAFIKKFKAILKKQHIDIVAVNKNKDFKPPGFNNNVISGPEGCRYVDIQNFAILRNRRNRYPQGLLQRFDPAKYQLTPAVARGQELSWWNSRKLNRKIARFASCCDSFLSQQDLTAEGLSLFDAGYPLGLFTLWALSSGARWSWVMDVEKEGKIVEKYLFENGFSRFGMYQIHPQNKNVVEIRHTNFLCYSLKYGEELFFTLINTINVQYLLVDTCLTDYDKIDISSVDTKLKKCGFRSVSGRHILNDHDINLMLYHRKDALV